MKYKRKQLLSLYQSLKSVGNLKGVKFAYAVSKNLQLLESEIKSINEAQKPSEKFQAYDKARVELAKKHAKTEEGKPVVKNNSYVIENEKAFNEELETLKTEHKEALDEREVQLNEFKELLKGEVEIELHKVKMDDVPADITVTQMEGIFAIIE